MLRLPFVYLKVWPASKGVGVTCLARTYIMLHQLYVQGEIQVHCFSRQPPSFNHDIGDDDGGKGGGGDAFIFFYTHFNMDTHLHPDLA